MGSGFFKYWLAQQARGFWLSVGPPNGFGGRVVFFQWSAQRAREDSFFNGSPNGPGRIRFSMVRPTGLEGFRFSMVRPTRLEGFRFSMVCPTGPGGFVFKYWFAQRVCGVGVGFLSTGSPNGSGG